MSVCRSESPNITPDLSPLWLDWTVVTPKSQVDQIMTDRHHTVIAPNGELREKDKVSKRNHPKSRNGCVTCKSKRMKCDETKPSCQQCSRRKVVCGGYQRGLKWKQVGNLTDAHRTGTGLVDDDLEDAPQTIPPTVPNNPAQVVGNHHDMPAQDPETGLTSLTTSKTFASIPRNSPFVSSHPSRMQSTIQDFESIASIPTNVGNEDCSYSTDTETYSELQPGLDNFTDHLFNQSPRSISDESPSSAVIQAANFGDHDSPHLHRLMLQPIEATMESSVRSEWHSNNHLARFDLMDAEDRQQLDEASQDLSQLISSMAEFSNLPEDVQLAFNSPTQIGPGSLQQQLEGPENTPEMIETIFSLQTCKTLSIKDHWTKNPWRTIVWPLAHDCPALYHALAAMTCLHMGKTQPQLRSQGKVHFEYSMQALTASDDNGSISLEAALAARLALGFAESWDHQISSTGITHITAAKIMVRQAVSRHNASPLSGAELSRLSFLANTWMYMDVLARITCADDVGPADHELMTTCSLLSPIPSAKQIDPLMGCAITLFPMISRLADLVSRVSRTIEKGNRLNAVSIATELKLSIERWNPPLDFERSEDAQSSIADSIQTAEAYRWASLLLLRQTVPEVPWTHGMWELAQKTLVFLATIPLESPTTIVQIFPLMLAGCEAIEKEDRDWVRQRWELMSKFLITGIVDRCQEVTAEVWRRRDEFSAQHGILHPFSPFKATPLSPLVAEMNLSQNDANSTFADASLGCGPSLKSSVPPRSSDFPVSLAFKKGIDPMTRAGYMDYTVKGDLHWLRVMKDWDLQVLLG